MPAPAATWSREPWLEKIRTSLWDRLAATAADPLPPLCWRLGQLDGGIALTQTGNLSQSRRGIPSPLTRMWIRAALAEQAAAVAVGLSDIKGAERAGELLSLTLREDTRDRRSWSPPPRRDLIHLGR